MFLLHTVILSKTGNLQETVNLSFFTVHLAETIDTALHSFTPADVIILWLFEINNAIS